MRLQLSELQNELILQVRDFGVGVPEQSLTKLFDPFYRVDTGRDRKTDGNGLGLAIAARAVAVHQGKISAANAAEGGLIIKIRLPMLAKQV